jgi:UDP-3-O-[3-hydroxymyristoyl] glucosamine N-acyltransferase
VIRARIGDRCDIDSSVELVGPTTGDNDPQKIGHGATIRSGAVIYHDVVIGCNLTTGHDVLIREESTIGDDVLLGTRVVIDGQCTIGNEVSLQTGAYVLPRRRSRTACFWALMLHSRMIPIRCDRRWNSQVPR